MASVLDLGNSPSPEYALQGNQAPNSARILTSDLLTTIPALLATPQARDAIAKLFLVVAA